MMASEELGPTEAWREVAKRKYASGAMIPA